MLKACSLIDMQNFASSGPVTAIPLAYMVLVINGTYHKVGPEAKSVCVADFLGWHGA